MDMKEESVPFFARIKRRARSRLVSGALVLVPVAITIEVMVWLFRWMAHFLDDPIKKGLSYLPAVLSIPDYYVTILSSVISVAVLVGLMYLTGVVTAMVAGRRLLEFGESLLLRIPLAKTIYSATKQVIQSAMPERTGAFKAVVVLEFPRPGIKAVGFLTGAIEDPDGVVLYKIFIPNTPNPTTGFFELVPPGQLDFTDLSVEDGFKMVVSGGILCPDRYGRQAPPSLESLTAANNGNNARQRRPGNQSAGRSIADEPAE